MSAPLSPHWPVIIHWVYSSSLSSSSFFAFKRVSLLGTTAWLAAQFSTCEQEILSLLDNGACAVQHTLASLFHFGHFVANRRELYPASLSLSPSTFTFIHKFPSTYSPVCAGWYCASDCRPSLSDGGGGKTRVRERVGGSGDQSIDQFSSHSSVLPRLVCCVLFVLNVGRMKPIFLRSWAVLQKTKFFYLFVFVICADFAPPVLLLIALCSLLPPISWCRGHCRRHHYHYQQEH